MSSRAKTAYFLKRIEAVKKKPIDARSLQMVINDLENFIAQNPGHLRALNLYAYFQLRNSRPDLAGEACSRILTLDKKNVPAMSQLLHCYVMIGDMQKALQCALNLKSSKVSDTKTLEMMGDTFVFNEEYFAAKEVFKKLTAIHSGNSNYQTKFGSMLHYCNDVSAARLVLTKACGLSPLSGQAHWLLSHLDTVTDEKNHLPLLQSALESNSLSTDAKIYLHFALAKEKEDLGRFNAAFSHLKIANALKFDTISHQAEEDTHLFTTIKNQYLQLSEKMGNGCYSREPIFIVGMPRTGTTLVEQVLGGEENVFLAGELQAFYKAMCQQIGAPGQKFPMLDVVKHTQKFHFKNLGQAYIDLTRPRTGSTRHFIDKMPMNFLHLGTIHKALPNAKFIHLIRDPIDTCLSNFKTLFGAGMYPHSYNLQALATHFYEYKKLMEFWNEQFGAAIINIHYEDIVAQPESQFRLIFEHCDFLWDNQYLQSHLQNKAVGTASAAQVRQPIYSTSVQKWRKFESHLDPLIETLKDLSVI